MLTLISFGYLHLDPIGGPPRADRTEDVRDRLRDPAGARHLIELTGLDPRVRDHVAATPGALGLLDNLLGYATIGQARPTRIAIGCSGGRHRAPALVELLATRLRHAGVQVEVQHLHVDRPVVRRSAEQVVSDAIDRGLDVYEAAVLAQCEYYSTTLGRCTAERHGEFVPHRFSGASR